MAVDARGNVLIHRQDAIGPLGCRWLRRQYWLRQRRLVAKLSAAGKAMWSTYLGKQKLNDLGISNYWPEAEAIGP